MFTHTITPHLIVPVRREKNKINTLSFIFMFLLFIRFFSVDIFLVILPFSPMHFCWKSHKHWFTTWLCFRGFDRIREKEPFNLLAFDVWSVVEISTSPIRRWKKTVKLKRNAEVKRERNYQQKHEMKWDLGADHCMFKNWCNLSSKWSSR